MSIPLCSKENLLNNTCACTLRLSSAKHTRSSPFAVCSNLFFYLFIVGFLAAQALAYFKSSHFQLSEDQIRRYSEEILENNQIDYASEDSGGSVIIEQSSGFLTKNPLSFVISNNNSPGECWGFEGQTGWVLLNLSQEIVPKSFEIIHLNSVDYSSAPNSFLISGINQELKAVLLYSGQIDMQIKGESRKSSFMIRVNNSAPFSKILLNITSNHGSRYTCVYQFKVHGLPIINN